MAVISTIPASMPFADTLAKGLLARVKNDPYALTQYRILLPTRRACRILREAFLRQGDGQLMLLPRLESIGDPDEDELSLLDAAGGIGAADIPPAIHPMARLAALSKLLRDQESFEGSYEQSLVLAKALMRFLDEVYLEDKNLDDLKEVVQQEELAEHWQLTLDFLDILKTGWPQTLQKMGVIDAADRRNRLLNLQADIWSNNPPKTPVIAAGVTGSVPATSRIFKTIMCFDKGEIILPGLDTNLEEKVWADLEENHPQYSFKQLLNTLSITTQAIGIWADCVQEDGTSRELFLSEVMRPAKHTVDWGKKMLHKNSTDNLSLLECQNHDEEASSIAFIMREVLEDEQRRQTATLVTPDRNLALRVKEKLQRWGIRIDDSAGTLLSNTSKGLYLRSIVDVVLENFSPVTVLNLLKQDLCGNGLVDNIRSKARLLDEALRGPKPLGGKEKLLQHIVKNSDVLAEEIKPILDLLEQMAVHKKLPLKQWIEIHLTVAENIATADDKSGQERLWSTESGEALAKLFSSLFEQSHQFEAIDLESYAVLLEQLMRGVTLRPLYGQHPRLTILGQMESRLYHADVIILGGLNEGVWPSEGQADPWMSRLMRRDFGLPSSEQKIGFAAHDFVQLAAAKKVIMTRAKTVESVPTLPSRWLQRMEAVLKAYDLKLTDASHYMHWAHLLDYPLSPATAAERPAPMPASDKRFRKVSVTGVQEWMKDPYAVYAKYILALRKWDDLEQVQDHAQKGSLIHDTLYAYLSAHQNDWPATAQQDMLEIFHTKCKSEGIDRPELLQWYPRLLSMISWFDDQEKKWRGSGAKPTGLEQKGGYEFETSQGPFRLEAKADRLDKLFDGSLAIIDYKTSAAMSVSEVKKGFLPQLPLEGLIAEKGSFDKTAAPVSTLQFWQIIGHEKTDGLVKTLPDTRSLIDEAEAGLKSLVDIFEQQSTPYYSLPDEANQPLYQDYAHLARVKEWANESDSDSEVAA